MAFVGLGSSSVEGRDRECCLFPRDARRLAGVAGLDEGPTFREPVQSSPATFDRVQQLSRGAGASFELCLGVETRWNVEISELRKELYRLRAQKAGLARLTKISPERRKEIALKAVQARWAKAKADSGAKAA